MLETLLQILSHRVQLNLFFVGLLFVIEVRQLEAKHDNKNVRDNVLPEVRRLGDPDGKESQHYQAVHGVVVSLLEQSRVVKPAPGD